ncbi:hypothetical protein OZX74_03385 [Bifidobacterium sp. ESL0798]|uniref:hypothetical protein n=1 Tax=Bifidobacterium sp. ESL0798 TaxID=2983235 RepID=UPI0023FA1858|nr:hypothetical protein [Bifidobacterium sp. ESL0798]WEV74578.1 hypothetical protein OZX74_03385 [Bifidobacterium sp. ESL0798]
MAKKRKKQKLNYDPVNVVAAVRMATEDLTRCLESFDLLNKAPAEINSTLIMVVLPHYMRVLVEADKLRKSLLRDNRSSKFQLPHTDEADQFEQRMRNRLKLIDDTSFDVSKMENSLESIVGEFYRQFRQENTGLKKLFQTDLGIYLVDKHPVGANFTVTFHLGYDSTQDMESKHLEKLSADYGRDLVVLFGIFSNQLEVPTAPKGLGIHCQVEGKDYKSERYFGHRYTCDLPLKSKLLLFVTECGVNELLYVLPQFSSRFCGTYFRQLVVTAYHSLHTLKAVIPVETENSRLEEFRDLIANDAVTLFLESKQGKILRDRCMHYLNRDPRYSLDPNNPENSALSFLWPGQNMNTAQAAISSYLQKISLALSRL